MNFKQARRDVLIFSQRKLNTGISRCSGYEFEDVVAQVEGADILMPARAQQTRVQVNPKRWLSKHTGLFKYWTSGVPKTRLEKDYDVFVCNVQKPIELLALDAIPNWRERTGVAICVLEEVWAADVALYSPLIKSLSEFDLITCAFAETCELLHRLTGKPVIQMPAAVDMVRFAPAASRVERPVDVYSMGRRRPELHEKLVKAMKARGGFYLYDTATKPPVTEQQSAHRELLASIIQHSKLFVVDIAKFGHKDQCSGHLAWGPRQIEGMAGGAVQVGYAPETPDYYQYFDWPEAVFRLPEDSDEALESLLALLDNPAEQHRRRKINFANSLQRHDWVHRWASVLEYLDLPETVAMIDRHSRLNDMSRQLGISQSEQPDLETIS